MPVEKGSECVQVVVRCRPMNSTEKNENCQNVCDIDLKNNQIYIRDPANPKEPSKGFTYDGVYDQDTIQKNFYDESCSNIIESVLEGFNGTIFAYGQTGCGKSFTMQGKDDPPELRGVIPHAINHIFEFVNATKDGGHEFLVRCSYLEIYNEELTDLLGDPKNPPKCEIKEDPQKGVFVKNLSDVIVENEKEMNTLLERGMKSRHVAATLMNAESSRSHSIFTIIVEMGSKDESGKDHLKAGKLNLVDLAGSERQKKTGASGAQLKEGSKINLSLSALGNVISALADVKAGKTHVPYRDSKLTRLLQDSLGGNTKTLMIAAISPADKNFDETLSTLRYANRAKNIKNKPKINEDPKDTMLREHKEEIEKLKQMLAALTNGNINALSNTMAAGLVTAAAAPTMMAGESIDKSSSSSSSSSSVVEVELMKANQLIQEHSGVVEKLKEKELEIEKERNIREELNNRIHQLQSKLAGGDNAVISQDKSPEELELEEKRRAENKARALKRREKREKLKQKLLKMKLEKQALEEQLLSGGGGAGGAGGGGGGNALESTQLSGDQQDNMSVSSSNGAERKLKKKIKALTSEIDDLKEDARFEKNQLLETISEQAKDMKLYEQICRAIMGDKELKRAVERSQWSEDSDEWLLPVIKSKDLKVGGLAPLELVANNMNSLANFSSYDSMISINSSQLPSLYANNNPSYSSHSSRDASSSRLPDINGKAPQGNLSMPQISGTSLDVSGAKISNTAKQRVEYNLDDRVEYNPSMAKLQNFSLLSTTTPKPSTPDKEKKLKSARHLKLKKEEPVAVNGKKQENSQILINSSEPKDQEIEEDLEQAQEEEYPDDYENEFEADYAGPITDWGFIIPSEGNEPQQVAGQNKEKKIKKKKSKQKNQDQDTPKLSLPPI